MTASRRQRDVPDGADEKWHYPEHTAAKHEILRRYLGAWLAILGRGRRHSELVLLDGFAGRGRYLEGQPGSPAIMFERAMEVANDGKVEKVWIRCAEPDSTNFKHLKEVADGLSHPRVLLGVRQETFEDVALRFITWAKRQARTPPTFVMIDPYGVKGVKLDTIKALLSFERVEVFLTLMVRDPARFLEGYDQALTALFGGEDWRQCAEEAGGDRPECLMRAFEAVARPSAAKYVLPYKVHEDTRQQVLYYLVHLTNSDLGMRTMKERMIRKSGEMTFFPITLRPTDQMALDVAEQSPYPTLQRHLRSTYAGRSMTFVELLNEDYPLGQVWVEGAYKYALRAMEQDSVAPVEIQRLDPLTRTGKRATRIDLGDTLTFSAGLPML